MNKERNLLPWILGGVATAAVAIAIAAVSNRHATPIALASAPAEVSPTVERARPAVPDPVAVSPAAVSVAPTTANSSAPAPVPASSDSAANSAPASDTDGDASPQVQPGQIWACTTKGVKTYSNNPCGEHASLLEVGPINTMRPTTPVRYANAYPAQPQYLPPYSDPRSQAYADDESDQDSYDNGANVYTIVQGVAVLPRRRPGHHRREPPYHHVGAPDHRAGAPDHHPATPGPRRF